MNRLYLLSFLLLSWIFGTAALDLAGKVVWNDVCPSATALGRAKVILDDGKWSGGVTIDGSFTIPNVPVGTYLLSIIARDFSFDQLRVDVTNATAHVHPYTLGTPFNPPSQVSLAYPVELVPKSRFDYYIPPHSFNLLGMLSNPMVLIGLGAIVLFALNSFIDVEALQENMRNAEQAEIEGKRSTALPSSTEAPDQARAAIPPRRPKKSRR